MHLDVYRNSGEAAQLAPFLVQLQHQRSQVMQTVLVAPLLLYDDRDDLGKLTPRVRVDDRDLLVSAAELFAIDKRRLGSPVTNLAAERDRIVSALDFLFTGI